MKKVKLNTKDRKALIDSFKKDEVSNLDLLKSIRGGNVLADGCGFDPVSGTYLAYSDTTYVRKTQQ